MIMIMLMIMDMMIKMNSNIPSLSQNLSAARYQHRISHHIHSMRKEQCVLVFVRIECVLQRDGDVSHTVTDDVECGDVDEVVVVWSLFLCVYGDIG